VKKGKKIKVANPHDKFFRETWSDRETAIDFIRNYLPGNILSHINTDRLEICKDSFIDDEFRDYFSDLLYRVDIWDKKGYLYFLFEHKSFSDKLASLQIIDYMIRIWELDLKQKKKR
jgi:predicted transposase/invertase (TIGR01784 family)